MSLIVVLISLSGTVALLLWGTRMVQTGVQRAFGARLRGLLGRALSNRLRAFLAGLGVTALLQSSTATGLMVAGFAAGGVVGLVPALAVMLGANLGTTLIVQLLSFDMAMVAPALILLGFILFRREAPLPHDLGRAVIGLGLMLMALHQLVALMGPYEATPQLRALLGLIAAVPLLDVLVAALMSWALHSSVATVLLIMSLAEHGVVSPEAALAMVIGANLGSALNPLLEGGGGDPAGRRLPLGNLLNRLVGLAIAMPLLGPAAALLGGGSGDAGRAVAQFHSLFNLVLAALFLPLLTPYAALLRRLLPRRENPADPARPLYLDPAAREVPVVALGGAAREALRLADLVEAMLRDARGVLATPGARPAAVSRQAEDALDRLNRELKTYLAGLDTEELSEADQRRVQEILLFAMHLEQAGDVVQGGLLPHAGKLRKRGLMLSAEGRDELLGLIDRVIGNLRIAASLLMTEDARAAWLLAAEKAAFRDVEAQATVRHFERLRAGRLESLDSGGLHLDLLRDLKLVNSHVVAAAAYPVLEREGELRPSRLVEAEEATAGPAAG
ncbi:Na/Pi cotransporter family protein [Roseomonas sp. KE0001]|uniref:Na/Pi cotransporter family protein n=1 Tax=Roseomonas sp. KE0001 TaxID=2479201 RepID=UPI0018DF8371|nr:Na/Pi cotransporter family protein [Roseomonas sp. KE0001]MBI0433707.1 Na/Pi cotransporter family protein [Roseomonas sp. KE0001]